MHRTAHTFRLQLEALAHSILTGASQVNASLEDGIACVKAMVAASYSSLHGGQWIDLESVAGTSPAHICAAVSLLRSGEDKNMKTHHRFFSLTMSWSWASSRRPSGDRALKPYSK